ncbi:type IV toxin-antitoxin system AbiEi family antitoxin [Curtobacterium sp. SP.BCo]|uniref:type IV toxin-antitoxin system AbiEi family antitoxin n=1 Tax=Curtobacterium sp. SP.BCo TaxID=3435229 RepID=UPI003F73607E
MPRSPLLTSDDWPESELRAAVLAGELVPVGPCWASPAEPQTPELRAAAARWTLGDPRLIAGTRTAAWIWGAVSRPPSPLEACVPPQVRVHVPPGVRLRELVVGADDVVHVGGLPVTLPARTALDLLRTPANGEVRYGTAESDAVLGLVVSGAVGVAEVLERLSGLGTVPMVRQAERRLRTLLRAAQPALTRYTS